MKIRFYIDTAADHEVVKAIVEHAREMDEKEFSHFSYMGETVKGITFKRDEQGLFVETNTFANGVPHTIVERELPIRVVTLYDEDHSGRPTAGIYKTRRARAIVDHSTTSRRDGSGGLGGEQVFLDIPVWRIRVTGKDINAIEDLYRKFRRGDMQPHETWVDYPKPKADPITLGEADPELERLLHEEEGLQAIAKRFSNAIMIWRFSEAPSELQHSLGGDEDFVIVTSEGNDDLATEIAESLLVSSMTRIPETVLFLGEQRTIFVTQHA